MLILLLDVLASCIGAVIRSTLMHVAKLNCIELNHVTAAKPNEQTASSDMSTCANSCRALILLVLDRAG